MHTPTIIKSPDRTEDEAGKLITWRNRKRMAWLSFYGIILYTLVLWFVLPVYYNHAGVDQQIWVQQVADSTGWLYSVFGGVILGYMGTTAWAVRGKDIQVDERDY
jgi:predicted nucleic acid-binding Zn ribbon protein